MNSFRALLVGFAMTMVGCGDQSRPTIAPVATVDLSRFMGDWYVIAHIPTRLERNAYDAVESYELRPDGRIQTTFHYRNKSFSAPFETLKPVGTIRPGFNNAVWGMQFICPNRRECHFKKAIGPGEVPAVNGEPMTGVKAPVDGSMLNP